MLLTGFDPFGGATINASWQAARAIDGEEIAGYQVTAAQLPTAFGAALERLDALLAEHHPALVVCLGQASTRAAISVERVAINLEDARIPDNAGAQPVDRPVVAGGPVAYFSGLPVKAMVQAVRERGLLAEVSQTAGTFVCNHVFYGLMHRAARAPRRGLRGGFIHVPALPGQVAAGDPGPSMPLERLVEGIRAAIEAAIRNAEDVRLIAGDLG